MLPKCKYALFSLRQSNYSFECIRQLNIYLSERCCDKVVWNGISESILYYVIIIFTNHVHVFLWPNRHDFGKIYLNITILPDFHVSNKPLNLI